MSTGELPDTATALRDIMFELGGAVDHLHAAAAKHIGWAQQHRIADPLGHPQRLVAAARDAVGGLLQLQTARPAWRTARGPRRGR